MSDLKKYIAKRIRTDQEFADGFDEGCEQFKIGIILHLHAAQKLIWLMEYFLKPPCNRPVLGN